MKFSKNKNIKYFLSFIVAWITFFPLNAQVDGKDVLATDGNRDTIAENSDLSLYFPERRQKFSPTATQCGILTSFGPNSPSMS